MVDYYCIETKFHLAFRFSNQASLVFVLCTFLRLYSLQTCMWFMIFKKCPFNIAKEISLIANITTEVLSADATVLTSVINT